MKDLRNNLIARISSTRKLILQSGGYDNFKNFIEDELGKKSGLSKSNISKMLKMIGQTSKQDLLESYEFKVTEFENIANRFAQNRKGNSMQFLDTIWYLYFFYRHPYGQADAMLGRAILNIDNNGDVRLENVRDESSQDYTGKFELINDYAMFFYLKGTSAFAKLHLKVITGPKPTPIAIGMSLSFEHQSVLSNTFILEQRTNNEKLSTGSFTYNNHEFKDIELPIRKYLSLKSKNNLKIPKGVRKLDDLRNFMARHKTQKRGLFYDFDKPQIFISSPTPESVTDEKYNHEEKAKVINDIIRKLKTEFEQGNIHLKFHYPGERSKNTKGNLITHQKMTINVMDDLKYCKYFILIYDHRSASKSLVELGWAMAHCKVILILYERNSGFPEGLHPFEHSDEFRIFIMESFSGTVKKDRDFIQDMIKKTILVQLKDIDAPSDTL